MAERAAEAVLSLLVITAAGSLEWWELGAEGACSGGGLHTYTHTHTLVCTPTKINAHTLICTPTHTNTHTVVYMYPNSDKHTHNTKLLFSQF